jgi:uncharacterized protein GlcG (DUF336 family)
MKHAYKMLLIAAGSLINASASWADTLSTHRIPAALAVEAVSETVAACARQGYRETAVVLDADGAVIAALRGDGAGIRRTPLFHSKTIHSLWPSAPRARIRLRHSPSCRTFGGGVVIKLGDEVVGSIGASGAPGAKLDDGCAHAGLDKIRDQLR